ncbi:MAG TPA: LOG family protein, partial [Actinomycetota bacterium]|nr:LOG family protein [Actinomycetota bacterium]
GAEALRRTTVAGEAAAAPDGASGSIVELDALSAREVPRRVAVFGGAWTGPDEEEHAHAVALGRRLAGSGIQVVSGGYQGIMDAVSVGAAEEGGVAVGVTIATWADRSTPSSALTHEARARDLFARLPLICDAEAWIAFSGGAGTLAEVALCWNLLQADPEPNRPLVVVGDRWGRAIGNLREHLVVVEQADWDLIRTARDAEQAAGQVAAALEGSTR